MDKRLFRGVFSSTLQVKRGHVRTYKIEPKCAVCIIPLSSLLRKRSLSGLQQCLDARVLRGYSLDVELVLQTGYTLFVHVHIYVIRTCVYR